MRTLKKLKDLIFVYPLVEFKKAEKELRFSRSFKIYEFTHQKDCVDNFFNKLKKGIKKVGISLSSQAASSQVFSASSSLTTVFEMGTGVPWISSTPTSILYHPGYKLSSIFFNIYFLNNVYGAFLNIYIKLIQNYISPKYF